jgi:hypothetical protein
LCRGRGGAEFIRLLRSSGFLGAEGDFFEIAFFAAGDEALGMHFQAVPDFADLFRFIFGDAVIDDGLGDFGEEVGELLDDFVGGGDDFETVGAKAAGVSDEEAAGPLAEPLVDIGLPGEFHEFVDAVERVATAAAFAFLGGLGPLVDEGEGEMEFGGDFFGAGSFERFFDDFVGFHDVRAWCEAGRL